MGKHEAPAETTVKKKSTGSPKHAAPAEKEGFRLSVPSIKLPKLPNLTELSRQKLPKVKLFSEEEYEEDDEEADENESDDDVRIVPERKIVETPFVDGNATEAAEIPAEPVPEEAGGEFSEEEPDEPRSVVRRQPALPKPDWTAIRSFFEKFAAFGVDSNAAQAHRRTYAFSRNEILITAGSALLFFLLWLLPTTGWLRFVLYLVPFFLLGAYTLQDAVGEVLDRVIPGRNLMISVSAIGLLLLSQPRAAVFVMLIHRIFLLLEAWLYELRASKADQLQALIPRTALTETEEGLEKKDPAAFKPGDILFVPAGELVALDGVVVKGISSLDASALCGQGTTLDVGVNSRVYAGFKNVTNPLYVRVTNEFDDSTVSRLVKRVKTAADSEPSRSALIETILSYLPAALAVLGIVIGLIVSLVTGAWRTWLYRGLILIAIGGCGDALLSARTAYVTGIYDAFREGVSFLNDDVIDRFATTDMMIFSKTGSITEGKYSVVAVYPVDYEEKDLLTIAALAECQSMHPIAVALREACGIEIHHRSDITLLEETPGRGIHALFGGRNVYVGNSSLLLDHNIIFDVPSHKGTVIHVAVDNKYAGCIVLNDRIREGAYDAMEELRLRGVRATVMLTGDVRSMARPIASSLSFDMVKCELSNEAKLDALNYLRDSKGNSAAIGYVSSKDEDADILASADIGVGFATLSQYRLLSEASVLILDSKIFQIPQALFLAKRISVAALLDMAVMLGLELLLIILGLCGAVSIWVAMLLLLLARIGTLVYTIYFK